MRHRPFSLTALLAIPLLWPLCGVAGPSDLNSLLSGKQLSIHATGTGVHSGDAVLATVKNTTGNTVSTSIPAGWTFASADEQVQDLIVVREERFVLRPGASRTITCRAFCTQGGLRGPNEGERYRPGDLAAPQLVSLAQAVDAGAYDDHVVQAAVWVLSDGYAIAGMGALDSTATDTLRMLVARLSGQPPPRYGVRFVEEPGRVCTGRPGMVEHRFDMAIAVPSVLYAAVLDAQGKMLQVLEDRSYQPAGRYARRFEVPVEGYVPGRYAIHVWTISQPGVHRLPFTL